MRAGFGKVELPVPDGVELVGAPDRELSAGVHDPLYARALVLEAGGERVALCSVDLCWVSAATIDATAERLAARGALTREGLFVSATHTHSGPSPHDPCFPDGLEALIEAAVVQACDRLEPARLGAGWGMLVGHTLNRRRFEDPVDPAVFALRVDAEDGRPLGVYYGFACHPVVLGPDSSVVSGDWPGVTSRRLEEELGEDAVALFGQGGCGDVNPLTAQLREQLDDGRPLTGMVERLRYHGPGEPSGDIGYNIGFRHGGTVQETEQLGEAVAQEALRVYRGIAPQDVERVWTRQLKVPARSDRPARVQLPADHWSATGKIRADGEDELEVMLVGIDGPGVVLVGQPGEVFVASAVELRRQLREAGFENPYLVGYANGWRLYLPPADAYVDAGYEVEWAWSFNLPENLQDTIRERVLAAAVEQAPPRER